MTTAPTSEFLNLNVIIVRHMNKALTGEVSWQGVCVNATHGLISEQVGAVVVWESIRKGIIVAKVNSGIQKIEVENVGLLVSNWRVLTHEEKWQGCGDLCSRPKEFEVACRKHDIKGQWQGPCIKENE